MGTRRNLAEIDLVSLDEKLDPENPISAEIIGHRFGNSPGLRQCDFTHQLRLPALAVVSIDLDVADGFQEIRAAHMAQGEHGDLVIEIDEALDDHLSPSRAPAFLRILPGWRNIRLPAQRALPLSGAAHDGLHHAGHPDLGNGSPVFLFGGGETVGRCREAKRFRSQAAYAFTVHGKLRGAGCRDHGRKPLGLDFRKGVRGDRLHFRHHEMGAVLFDHRPQPRAIQHGKHLRMIRHLHGRGIRVGIAGDHLHAISLQLDHHLLAQFA